MYELARSGQEVPERVRPVTIHALELITKTKENRFLLRIGCSRGTYIRTLCEDIGKRLNVCAHMSFLLRTASGSFQIGEAYSIQELAVLKEQGMLETSIVSIQQALPFLLHVTVTDKKSISRLQNGCTEPLCECAGMQEDQSCLVFGDGELIGIGVYTSAGLKLKLHLEA